MYRADVDDSVDERSRSESRNLPSTVFGAAPRRVAEFCALPRRSCGASAASGRIG